MRPTELLARLPDFDEREQVCEVALTKLKSQVSLQQIMEIFVGREFRIEAVGNYMFIPFLQMLRRRPILTDDHDLGTSVASTFRPWRNIIAVIYTAVEISNVAVHRDALSSEKCMQIGLLTLAGERPQLSLLWLFAPLDWQLPHGDLFDMLAIFKWDQTAAWM